MPALIAPTICRFAVNGLYGGRPVVNIVDMQIDTTGSSLAREDACEAQAGIIINEWDDSILTNLESFYKAESVSWVDLNSATGSVGLRTSTDTTTFPQNGKKSGTAPMPGNVALRVNKNIVATRGQRQGRMYLAGASEASTAAGTPNSYDSAQIAVWNTALTSFLGDINQEEIIGPDNYTSKMVVVHTIDGVFTNYSDVVGLSCDLVLGSQRRRLRG